VRGLEQLDVLIGDWAVVSKKYPEGRGRTSVRPTEDGKFVRIDSLMEDERFPRSLQIVGSDDESEECTALYFDSRGVHRVYRMRVADGEWRAWRDAPGFNQRFTGKISEDGTTIAGQWEVSEDGKSWKVDFDLNFTKAAGGHS
jgi:hypothetical protein